MLELPGACRARQVSALAAAWQAWKAGSQERACKEAAADAVYQDTLKRKLWAALDFWSRSAKDHKVQTKHQLPASGAAAADKMLMTGACVTYQACCSLLTYRCHCWLVPCHSYACDQLHKRLVAADQHCLTRAVHCSAYSVSLSSCLTLVPQGLRAELLILGDQAERRKLQAAFQGWAEAAREQRGQAQQEAAAGRQLLQAAWQGLQAHVAAGRARNLGITAHLERSRTQRLGASFRMCACCCA